MLSVALASMPVASQRCAAASGALAIAAGEFLTSFLFAYVLPLMTQPQRVLCQGLLPSLPGVLLVQ